ncbi:MAG: DUF3808 domain-containing protein, partial [Alicyclobacillus sp.]|nr:DUF3808 domain-containing protein [Alicyclobacillus sp.]
AWILIHQGRVGDAIALLKQLGAVRRRDAAWQVQLGIAYLFAEDALRAERLLFNALPHYPDKAVIWLALGRASALLGQHAQAIARYRRALQDPRKGIRRLALYSHALLHITEARYEEAERLLKAASLLGPDNPAIFAALADVITRLGRRLEAQKWLSKAKALRSRTAR